MGQEEASPTVTATMAFSWEHEPLVPKPVSAPAMDADVDMPESPRKAAATVFLSWEHEHGMEKQACKPRDVPESVRKAQAPTRRLSVPPPPGRPSTRVFPRAVRPEDDPFLAAYLACTKSKNTGGHGDGGKNRTSDAREPKIRRFAWAGLGLGGLSCKRGDGAVVQNMVRRAKLPELDPSDA